MQRSAQISALILVAQFAQQAQAGGIPENGIWTGFDYYDEAKLIGVKNGEPYSKDVEKQRWLNASWTIDGKVDDYLETPHIARVKKHFPESKWDEQFTHIDKFFTYKDFIKSVAEFPAFCNENNRDNKTMDETCKRELATFFAHVTQETGARKDDKDTWWRQGLFYKEEMTHHDYKSTEYENDLKWPNVDGVQYYGRGPLQLSWNYNLGQFSNTFYSHSHGYDSKSVLLSNPGKLTEDNQAFLSFSSAMWFYMTPSEPKPSMHDVVTGYWEPNDEDLKQNITQGFGATINIINGAEECNKKDERAKSRGDYYLKWLDFFGLKAETGLSCEDQGKFPKGSAGDTLQFFDKKWDVKNSCQLVHYHTQYSVMSKDDYKRCVCDKWGVGEADCTEK